MEKGAGALASYSDAAYEAAGAVTVDTSSALASDIVLKLRPPTASEVDALTPGKTLVSFLYPGQNEELVKQLAAKNFEAARR